MLIRASLVPFVDPALIRELSGRTDTEEILRKFARRNLFEQGIYEPEKGWVFHFHQLFREFLLNRFQETFSEEERAVLYRKAASLFEERGDLEAAGNRYLLAKDVAAAAGMIRFIGLEMLDKGRREDLSKLLGALPEGLIQQDPWLLILFSLTRRWMEFQQNVDRLQRCLTLFEKAQESRGVGVSLSYLIETFFTVGFDWSIIVDYLGKAEAWIASPRSNPFPLEKAFIWLQIGIVHISRGNTRKGYSVFRNVYLLAKAHKNTI